MEYVACQNVIQLYITDLIDYLSIFCRQIKEMILRIEWTYPDGYAYRQYFVSIQFYHKNKKSVIESKFLTKIESK